MTDATMWKVSMNDYESEPAVAAGQEDLPADGQESRRGIHWPTVAVSAATAVVLGGIAPALVLLGREWGLGEVPVPTPVEVTVAAAAAEQPSGVAVLDPVDPEAGETAAPGDAGRAPASASGADADAGGAGAADSPPADSGAAGGAAETDQAPAGPQTPTLAQLDGLLHQGLDPQTGDGALASGLEGGAAAVPTVRSVGTALNLVGGVYQWRLLGPVTTDGDVARAQLETSMPGTEPTEATLKWYWIDGEWKLSNDSVCFLAHRAMTQCTVPGDPGGPYGHPA